MEKEFENQNLKLDIHYGWTSTFVHALRAGNELKFMGSLLA